jgi:hypothetical protein
MQRELGQLSLADGLVNGGAARPQLERIVALIDWGSSGCLANLCGACGLERDA